MDFAFPPTMLYPVVLALVFPLILFCVGLVRRLRANIAYRFFIAACLHAMFWVVGSLALPPELRPDSIGDWFIGAMVLGTFMLLYLEIWALLSRGYTLAMLLVLLKSRAPLSAEAIARDYRDGAGLEWIVHHRTRGLSTAGLVTRESGDIVLTRRGALVATLYAGAQRALGLSRTG